MVPGGAVTAVQSDDRATGFAAAGRSIQKLHWVLSLQRSWAVMGGGHGVGAVGWALNMLLANALKE